MELYVARHGQTDWNLENRFQGSIDMPLNPQGYQQAVQLASCVPRSIEQIVVSPQLRAQQSAAPVAVALDVPCLTMSAFRERSFGVWEGLTRDEARALDEPFYDRHGAFSFDECPPEGEPMAMVTARVTAGLRELMARYSSRTVLLITHGVIMRVLRCQLEGLSPQCCARVQTPANAQLIHYPASTVARWAAHDPVVSFCRPSLSAAVY